MYTQLSALLFKTLPSLAAIFLLRKTGPSENNNLKLQHIQFNLEIWFNG